MMHRAGRTGIRKPRQRWVKAAELVRSFEYHCGLPGDRLAILSAVWEKELGHRARHWELVAIQKGTLYIKARSTAAAYELHMQARTLVRNLNKHFSRSWIKAIKAAAR